MSSLEELRKQEKLLLEKLAEKRQLIGKADGPMESSNPSGRFELENMIELLEIQLQSTKEEIQRISPKS